MLGSSSQIADLQVDSRLIHPVQLRFVVYTPKFGGVTLTRNFDFTEQFGFPADASVIVIHDADGPQKIAIEDALLPLTDSPFGAESSADRATGFGASLQDAFDNAVKASRASAAVADDLLTYRLVETGFLRGGFAGFSRHYAVVEVLSPAAGAAAVVDK